MLATDVQTGADGLPDAAAYLALDVRSDEAWAAALAHVRETWGGLDLLVNNAGVVAMLSEDATFSMPPLSSWFGGAGGHRELTGFMLTGPLSGEWDWRHVLTIANRQPTLAFYSWYELRPAPTCRSPSTSSASTPTPGRSAT